MYSDSDSGNDSDDSRGGRGMPMDPLLHFFLTGGYLGFGGGRRRGRGGDIDSDDEGGGRARGRKRKPEKPHLPPLPMAEVAHLGLKELKELCKSRYLPVSGTKPALIARLTGGTEPDKVVSFKGPDPVAGLCNFFGIPSSQVTDSYSGFDPPDWETGRECDDPICEPDDNLQATLDDVGAAFRAAATAVAFHFDQVTSLEPPKLRIKTSPEGATTDVTFPLGAEHEQLLARVCKAAPFGRGEETVFDASVRRTLQLDPSEFTVASDAFAAGLASAINDIKAKLAPSSERVEATLYKLLYYPPGSFFRSHVDTQRGQDMFATLVVELQAPQGGGVLRITHDGKSVEIVPRFGTPARVRFTAFYTDCLHEVAEVTAGCRVALIYNLTRSGKAPAAEAPSNPILASVD